MPRNWNKIWRWVHLGLGLMLVVYHSRIAYVEYGWIDTAWSSDIDKFVSTTFVFMVMWTGLAKANIPLVQEAPEQEKKGNEGFCIRIIRTLDDA